MIPNKIILLSTLAASALAAPSRVIKRQSNEDNLWQVPAERDPKQPGQIKWTQINSVITPIDKAADDNRKFSYYPFLYNMGGTLFLLFSGAPEDVDGMGQDVRISYSTDGKWSKPEIAFPAALLPNQTTIQTSEYYCKRGIPQRALQALSIVYIGGDESDATYYAVAQSSDNVCPGHTESAGRIARKLSRDPLSGTTFSGDPCWIETNEYTGSHEWAETVYGTKYHMKVCDDKEKILAALKNPQAVPAQATSLFNAPLIAADGKHNVSYPTNAVYLAGSGTGRYMRFWSDVSVRNRTGNAFVEFTSDITGNNWFPATEDGSKIEQTNIYSSYKAWFGSSESATQTRVYISNSGMNSDSSQEILTVATSRGDDLAFRNIGILRSDSKEKVPVGTRPIYGSDVPGFYWPSAVFQGDQMVVAYSENMANIEVSTIKLVDLP
ncbi:hypothetical protein COCC4DRAFT_153174 [Bipolaris maydis ATCC 48331]|uniref:Glycoside hydrolase family 93 protein n=2 Tax=Cochliobolus heterostrophus TaxID=5016 RepID=M2TFY7_COCH5|nr:uncharacterized protein COCC4DRAFT_153174 [Bipolaris maydis ATCC 48331]EMD85414.1 hypothetical protein COCHEDRAFT_1207898 [Bipolaris maydis C5]KAH7548807.1 hypothetical protein BM1_10832 [Bipolaris maydis]ENH99422.1 hypothetical protein COCC4DRAFT_153174 [Bipolaris maydis ATCC 48331]KAJ5024632.1 hypothetical protein J3E73DRAFT_320793 [Bipolaris maydis]KAJ5056835.1 hypothetical protein J3E74DRAFT_367249 [Bipolaris maydis]